VSENISRKRFAPYFWFIYEHLNTDLQRYIQLLQPHFY